jgi:hypothetical protein
MASSKRHRDEERIPCEYCTRLYSAKGMAKHHSACPSKISMTSSGLEAFQTLVEEERVRSR